MGGTNCYQVRILECELQNFKNVNYGKVSFVNDVSVRNHGKLEPHDIMGIYGQNGSGKTAVVEALDIVKGLLCGFAIDYDEFGGLLRESGSTLSTKVFVELGEERYIATYRAKLVADDESHLIQLPEESLAIQQRGARWQMEKSFTVHNPYYENEALLNATEVVVLQTNKPKELKGIKFIERFDAIALAAAQNHQSVFFNKIVFDSVFSDYPTEEINGMKLNETARAFLNVLKGLSQFGQSDLWIVRVNQLAEINSASTIPLNVRSESEVGVVLGCIPLFQVGAGRIPVDWYELFEDSVESINIALKAIVPGLQIRLEKGLTETNDKGETFVNCKTYSVRGGRTFLTKYESEGIKRIISILNLLISVYNSPRFCLVIDELDSGIFEYLLGELLSVLNERAKGQLIFTSHNLRAMETLETKNIVCSTTNPNNRYVPLKGVQRTHNARDYYIRALSLGGQEEPLYDDEDMLALNYAFVKAGQAEPETVKKFKAQIQDKIPGLVEAEKEG